jgi:hypothetical protein
MNFPKCSLCLIVGLSLLASCGGEGGAGGVDPASPEGAFRAYRQAIRDGELDDLKAVLAADALTGLESVSPDAVIPMLQSFLPTGEEVGATEIDGDSATVHLTAVNEEQKVSGSVSFVKEDGQWKVKKEHWDMTRQFDAPEEDPEAALDETPDGEWRLDCHEQPIPDRPASGRTNGKPFTVKFARIQNSILTLTDGDLFDWDGEFLIFFFLPDDGPGLAGRTISMGKKQSFTDEVRAHVHYNFRIAEHETDGEAKADGFSMKIEFGKVKDGKLPGRLYLSFPDEKKSFVAGSFEAVLTE